MNVDGMPETGDTVLYYPNGGDISAQANNGRVLPAIVLHKPADVAYLLLSVHTRNADAPVVVRPSVAHKSDIWDEGECRPGTPFWDFK